MLRTELVSYLDDLLGIDQVNDYGPQGLQVEGKTEVGHVAVAVDAAIATIDKALAIEADLLLVHHGILWGGAQPLVGALGDKVRRLMLAEVNLYAAHLALDRHPQFGNNAELCRVLGLEVEQGYFSFQGVEIGVIATPGEPLSFRHLVQRFTVAITTPLKVEAYGTDMVSRVAVCSGDSVRSLPEAYARGCDTLITGERDYTMAHAAREMGMNVLYGGHYATETLGVKALGRHLAQKFALSWSFLDVPVDL